MDWDGLKVVLALGRRGTLSGAAVMLGVSHPTVSRKLTALQESLGVRLFERTPEGWLMTAEGEKLFGVAEEVEEKLLVVDRVLSGRDLRLSGTLRVWTPDIFVRGFVQEFRAFVELYPSIRLEIDAENSIPNLVRRETDIQLMFDYHMYQTIPEAVVGRKLGRVSYAVYGTEALATKASFEKHGDVTNLPWMSWHPRLGARMTEAWMKQNIPPHKVVCQVDRATNMVDCVAAGMGAMILPCFVMDPLANVRRLTPILPEMGVDLWLFFHRDLRTTARLRAFVEHMVTHVGARRAELAGECG